MEALYIKQFAKFIIILSEFNLCLWFKFASFTSEPIVYIIDVFDVLSRAMS